MPRKKRTETRTDRLRASAELQRAVGKAGLETSTTLERQVLLVDAMTKNLEGADPSDLDNINLLVNAALSVFNLTKVLKKYHTDNAGKGKGGKDRSDGLSQDLRDWFWDQLLALTPAVGRCKDFLERCQAEPNVNSHAMDRLSTATRKLVETEVNLRKELDRREPAAGDGDE